MKTSLLLFPLLLFFYLIVPQTYAEEIRNKTAGIPAEFQAEIEQYRGLANEPMSDTPPADPSLLNYENGLKFLRAGDGYSAIQTLKALLASTTTSEPLKKEVRATLGYMYLEQNRPKEALEEWTLLENEAVFKEKARFAIAWSLMEMEEYVKTIAVFGELVAEFPDGEYTPESLSKTGYCYSRLLSYKNAVESYQKALQAYNRRLQAQEVLLLASGQPIPFQRNFIFNNPDPNWKFFFNQIKKDPPGYEIMQGADFFFKMEERLQKNPIFLGGSPQYRQSLDEARTQIQNLFHQFIREQIMEKRKMLQDLSAETAVELARNLVLEQASHGRNSGNP